MPARALLLQPRDLPMPDYATHPTPRSSLPNVLAACAVAVLVTACGGDDRPDRPGALAPVAPLAASAGATGVVVADAPLPRPATTPCTIVLYSGMSYSGFDAHPFTYP